MEATLVKALISTVVGSFLSGLVTGSFFTSYGGFSAGKLIRLVISAFYAALGLFILVHYFL